MTTVPLETWVELLDLTDLVRTLQRQYRRTLSPFTRREMEREEARLDGFVVVVKLALNSPALVGAALVVEAEAAAQLAQDLDAEQPHAVETEGGAS